MAGGIIDILNSIGVNSNDPFSSGATAPNGVAGFMQDAANVAPSASTDASKGTLTPQAPATAANPLPTKAAASPADEPSLPDGTPNLQALQKMKMSQLRKLMSALTVQNAIQNVNAPADTSQVDLRGAQQKLAEARTKQIMFCLQNPNSPACAAGRKEIQSPGAQEKEERQNRKDFMGEVDRRVKEQEASEKERYPGMGDQGTSQLEHEANIADAEESLITQGGYKGMKPTAKYQQSKALRDWINEKLTTMNGEQLKQAIDGTKNWSAGMKLTMKRYVDVAAFKQKMRKTLAGGEGAAGLGYNPPAEPKKGGVKGLWNKLLQGLEAK